MKQINILSLAREIEKSLSQIYDDATACQQYAWWILQAITGKNQAQLMAQDLVALTQEQDQKLAHWLDRLINQHEPLQYLLGSVPFGDLDILVRPPTLIPRPETEEWVLHLIAQLRQLKNQEITILDLCTGTGCIALALAQAFTKAHVYAVDISEHAIELAKKNAAHNNINNVTFVHTDLFDALETNSLFDIIVSNPPYISFDEFEELDPSVRSWEDPQALVAHDDGLAIINQIIEQAPDYLKRNDDLKKHAIPQLVIEIGYKQGPAVVDLMHSFGFKDAKIIKDLEGKDRVVAGRLT